MRNLLNRLAIIAAVAGALAFVPCAHANLQLTLTNGATSLTITDGDAHDSCVGVDNHVCYYNQGPIGNYSLAVFTGVDPNGLPFLDLSPNFFTFAPNPGLLTLAVSSDGYTQDVPQFGFDVDVFGGTGLTLAAYGGNSNVLFDTSHQLGNTLNFPPNLSYAKAESPVGNTVNPYSLTIVATVNGSGDFGSHLYETPEPATTALLGSVLLVMAAAMRRKFSGSPMVWTRSSARRTPGSN